MKGVLGGRDNHSLERKQGVSEDLCKRIANRIRIEIRYKGIRCPLLVWRFGFGRGDAIRPAFQWWSVELGLKSNSGNHAREPSLINKISTFLNLFFFNITAVYKNTLISAAFYSLS